MITVALLFVVQLLSHSAHALDVEIDAPCSPYQGRTSTFLRPCTDYISKVHGENGYTGPTGVIPHLDAKIKVYSRNAYGFDLSTSAQGVLAPSGSSSPSSNSSSSSGRDGQAGLVCGTGDGPSFGSLVCNSNSSVLNIVPGSPDTDIVGRCGVPIHFTASSFIQKCCYNCSCRSRARAIRESFYTIKMDYTSTPSGSSLPYGSLEASMLTGAWIQALTCYWQQVRSEVSTYHKLRSISQACFPLATAMARAANRGAPTAEAIGKALEGVVEIGSDSPTLMKSLTEYLKTTSATNKNDTEIWKCDSKWLDTNLGSGASGLQGDLRQSAQQLCAARAGIEALFNQLVVCETMARASSGYSKLAPNGHLDEDYVNLVKNMAHNNSFQKMCSGKGDYLDFEGIQNQCERKCKGRDRVNYVLFTRTYEKTLPESCKACVDPLLTVGMNLCYQRWMTNHFRDKFKGWNLSTPGVCTP